MRTLLVLLLLPAFASGADYTVANKQTQYTVVNKMATVSQPAPAGYQWQKVGDEPWKLVEVTSRPFQERPVAYTPATNARIVGGRSTQSPGSTGMVHTLTPVPLAGQYGDTNYCPPSG